MSLVLLTPLLGLLFLLYDVAGSYWWIFGFLLFSGFQFLMLILYPLVIAPFFNTEALEPVAMKGKTKPMIPYRVTGASGVATRFEAAEARGFTTYTGREVELATLHEALEKAIGGRGQFITVVGAARACRTCRGSGSP